MTPPPCPHPALVAAGDEPDPTVLHAPTTMRTSADTIINLELEQPHIVHHLSAAYSADPEECDTSCHKSRPDRAGVRGPIWSTHYAKGRGQLLRQRV